MDPFCTTKNASAPALSILTIKCQPHCVLLFRCGDHYAPWTDLHPGHLFTFFSRRLDRVKIIYWDRNGFAMWTKRLERGRYRIANVPGPLRAQAVEWSDLALILEGIDLAGATRRSRWEPTSSPSPASTPSARFSLLG